MTGRAAIAHDERGRLASESDLVRFDRKTRALLGALLVLLALATGFKVHGSSIGVWYTLLGPDYRSPNAGVLVGTPNLDRIDEWNIFTPAIVSQAMVRPSFPTVNLGWGPAEVPLVYKFPARHWSMLVRPQLWGFFVLDLERAYAFYWNVQGVFFVTGMFLLLMLLTDNEFRVSLLGTAWAFFSGFTQWWYSNQLLPQLIGYTGLLIVAAHYLVLSRRRWMIGMSGIAFLFCAAGFALTLYPPYQIPLFYLGVTVGVASLGGRLRAARATSELGFRIATAGLALAALAVVVLLFYRDTRRCVDLMRATIYPGSRLVSGGDLPVAQVFGGFFGFFMTGEHFPRAWQNVCEASNFVLLFPAPLAALVWRRWHGRAVSAVEWSLAGYIAVLLTWTVVGWPRWLAVASAFGRSQPVRSLLGLGLANILLCCIWLARARTELPGSLRARLVVGGCLVTALLAYALHFDRVTSGFATRAQMALVVFVGGTASYLLLARRRAAFAACLLAPHLWSYALVNPVAVGLGPILESKLFQRVLPLVRRDPDARWAAYVDIGGPTFLKMMGANVFNGINIVPPMDDLRVIDPDGAGASVYNRSGYIVLVPEQGSTVRLTLVRDDLYEMGIDPKSDLLRRIGTRYVVLPAASTDPEFLAKTVVVEALPRFWIYRYLDDGGPARGPRQS